MDARDQPLSGKRILITSGPTWVALDPMRVISNRSTGAMGKELAVRAQTLGAKVTWVEGPVSQPVSFPGIRKRPFQFFDELRDILKTEISRNYCAIIHSAAVSDFRPRVVSRKKIDSDKGLKVELSPTEKLINKIKRAAPRTLLVGFKLTSQANLKAQQQAAARLFEQAHCDFIIANHLKNGYHGVVLDPHLTILAAARSRGIMARHILRILGSRL